MAYQLLPPPNKLHSSSSEVTKIDIDFQLAQSILDRLGYTLEDLSLTYGDVVIPSGDVSHQLWYDSIHNACTIMGYVWCENDIYYTSLGNNYRLPELAALDLLDPAVVQTTAANILLEREAFPDYS
jgi:hypothetical protein